MRKFDPLIERRLIMAFYDVTIYVNYNDQPTSAQLLGYLTVNVPTLRKQRNQTSSIFGLHFWELTSAFVRHQTFTVYTRYKVSFMVIVPQVIILPKMFIGRLHLGFMGSV